MVNQGTSPLSNLKVLLMEAPSFHSFLTLFAMAPTVLHSSPLWPMQIGLSFSHFTFSHFTFTFLQTQVILPGTGRRSVGLRGLHNLWECTSWCSPAMV